MRKRFLNYSVSKTSAYQLRIHNVDCLDIGLSMCGSKIAASNVELPDFNN